MNVLASASRTLSVECGYLAPDSIIHVPSTTSSLFKLVGGSQFGKKRRSIATACTRLGCDRLPMALTTSPSAVSSHDLCSHTNAFHCSEISTTRKGEPTTALDVTTKWSFQERISLGRRQQQWPTRAELGLGLKVWHFGGVRRCEWEWGAYLSSVLK